MQIANDSHNNKISRRRFIGTALAATVSVSVSASKSNAQGMPKPVGKDKFRMHYAPSFRMFYNHAGKDPIDNIKFAADEGFTAMFDNGIAQRSKQQQKAIAKEMAKSGVMLGPFILYADLKEKSFVTRDKQIRTMLIEAMKQGVETAMRVNAKWGLVAPGRFDDSLEWDYQTANVVDNLKYCCELLETAGLIMVIEPLNTIKNHPGTFLTKISQAYQICRAVNSPACKIVNDLYHQQITEGNLIANIDMAWDEIAAFHLGDTPGRKEPGTGEINYKNIFKHIHQKGYKGVLCMEHGNSRGGKEGEKAVIDAYRTCDNF